MKYYLIFGPPGAGKGTHAAALIEKYGLKHISTGALLRAEIAAGTELGREAASLIEKGCLVPDEVVEGMIASEFERGGNFPGYLLDGFPRTLAQAKDLDDILASRGETLTGVLSIMIPDELIFTRIKKRAAEEGRADDTSEEVIANRIRTYHEQTEPLIEYYKAAGKYHEVQGDSPVLEENRQRVLDLMESLQ